MRYLQLSAQAWEALSWDLQETYLDGLSQDPEVPFSVERSASLEAMPGGPVARKADTGGAQVFDIRGLIADLEADPGARRRT